MQHKNLKKMNENNLRKRHSHDHGQTNGFIEKLIKDCKNIYNNKHEIKYKNERPEKSKAYEPTEVRDFFLNFF